VKLVTHEVDLVISDAPLDAAGNVRTHNHLLGECGVTLFGAAALVASCRRGFPRSLNGQPFLLPAENTSLRRSLEAWFVAQEVRPDVCGEFTDSALLKTFGRAGVGVFAAPTAIEKEVIREYRVRPIGRIDRLRERFYVISASRSTQHPAVAAIASSARRRLFG
jgi:LysR family transcriptional activator of nhaA